MQAMLKNPYLALNPIAEPQMFFGPYSVLSSVCSAVANKQNASLIGTRHSGKTTLLRCLMLPDIQYRLGLDLSRLFFVYLDVRNCLRKTCEDFFEFLSDEMNAANQGQLTLAPSTKTGESKFIDMLKRVQAQGFHTVLLLDVFDEITRNKAFDPEFFMFLRAQATAGLVSYVTASIEPLAQISHAAIQGSPFFNIFGVYPIKPLAPLEAHDLIMIPSHEASCPFTEEECEWVLKHAGRHPFFIQRLCYYLFEEKSQDKAPEINKKRIANQAYRDLLPHFQYLWDDLSEEEQDTLKEEAQHNSLLERAMPELSESAFFRKFVRDTCGLQFFHMSAEEIEEELKEVLKHLDSPGVLAESKLRYLRSVARRIEEQGITSTYEKGRVIREVLTGALEQLQGEGPRADSNLSWMVYNILSYTYFNKKNTLTQAGIAQRLSISLRQYHREKDEAIQALCNRLLEMEAELKGDDEE